MFSFGEKLIMSFRSLFIGVEALYCCTGIAERAFEIRETAANTSSEFLSV